MKPAAFDYDRPTSLDEALALLTEHGPDAKVLAGGQSLLPLLSMRLAAPGRLIDINSLSELAYVRTEPAGVRIGALARHSAVLADADARQRQPLLAGALASVAHPTIRNRGTTVGSIVHADPAAEMPAMLSLLGGSVTARSSSSNRTIPAGELFLGPLESALRPDELAVEAFFPAQQPLTGSAFAEVSRRHGDYAVCGVGVLVRLDDDLRISSVTAGYLSIAGTPLVLDLTEPVRGLTFDADLGEAAALARTLVDPEPDLHASADYRRQLVQVLTGRVLVEAARAAAGGEPVSESMHRITLYVNGIPLEATVPARRLLSDCLRHDLGLTGTHVGCEHGVCGACTVLVGGVPMRSCLLLAVSMDGERLTTVEGLAEPDGSLSPVQRAFAECHGLQCGFCTPGFLTTITAGLAENARPSPAQAREMIGGNLCRCTGYQNIVASVLRAAEIIQAGIIPQEQGDPA